MEKSKNNQVYTTNNCNNLIGFVDNEGNYTVVPSRFESLRTAPLGMKLSIECQYTQNGVTTSLSNGVSVKVGGELLFTAKTNGGILDPIDKVKIWWEVSNGGQRVDSVHQEIYYKDNTEPTDMFHFKRSFSYKGTHLLRCHIYNKQKGSISHIFKVTGE